MWTPTPYFYYANQEPTFAYVFSLIYMSAYFALFWKLKREADHDEKRFHLLENR